MSDTADSISALAARAETGDATARDALFAALYQELHRLAQAHVRRHGGNVTLSATTLLHEAYVDLSRRERVAFSDRNRFFGYASRAMRGLVVNYVRNRQAQKRGGDLTFTTLTDGVAAVREPAVDLERLADALNDLGALDPSLAELVDLKFFCGFSFGDIASVRGVSERTVQRDWAKARLLLYRSLSAP